MILVIGGTGHVGRELVRELLERGAEFRVASRNPERVTEVLGPEVGSVPMDLNDPASVQRAVQSAEKVFLLTPGEPNDLELTRPVVDAARESGVMHLVRMSAFGADHLPTYSLGQVHRETELYLLASGVPSTIIRPESFMENLLDMAPMIAAEGRIYAPLEQVRIARIAVRDIGATAAAILLSHDEHINRSYDLTGPQAMTMDEVAATLGQALGRRIEYVNAPEEQMREGMRQAGMPEWLAEGLLDLDCFYRREGGAPVNRNVELITGRVPQDLASWATEHREQFALEMSTA